MGATELHRKWGTAGNPGERRRRSRQKVCWDRAFSDVFGHRGREETAKARRREGDAKMLSNGGSFWAVSGIRESTWGSGGVTKTRWREGSTRDEEWVRVCLSLKVGNCGQIWAMDEDPGLKPLGFA
jgi:hypothetical protein